MGLHEAVGAEMVDVVAPNLPPEEAALFPSALVFLSEETVSRPAVSGSFDKVVEMLDEIVGESVWEVAAEEGLQLLPRDPKRVQASPWL